MNQTIQPLLEHLFNNAPIVYCYSYYCQLANQTQYSELQIILVEYFRQYFNNTIPQLTTQTVVQFWNNLKSQLLLLESMFRQFNMQHLQKTRKTIKQTILIMLSLLISNIGNAQQLVDSIINHIQQHRNIIPTQDILIMIEFVKEINCFETMFKQHYLKVSYQYYPTITTIQSLYDQYLIEEQLNQAIDDDVWMELKQYYHKMIMTAIPLANFDLNNTVYMQKLYKLNQITKQTNYRLQLYNNVLMEVSNIRNTTNPIDKLIELKFNYEAFINLTSPGDDRILQALDGALQQGILEKVNTLSELFSAHLDVLMTKQDVVKNEDALFEQLKSSLTLFKYFSARDIFEKFYTQRMTRRLLLELHISTELECKILELLKQQCGDQYVRKAEEILMDVNNQSAYQVDSTECRVVLISQNSWTLNTTKLPEHFLKNLKDNYIQQNQQQFKQKLILWQQECSTCQLKAFNKYTLQVSVIQAMILMYFNDASEYQISDLLTKSTVSKDELLKNILPLVGNTLLIRNQDTFMLNREFNSKKQLIRVNQMQKKESKQEIDETQSRVLNDRKYIIDACIVKIMKRDKKHSMVEILKLVHSELGLPINTSDIKLQVEVLTSKDYLARDPENMSQFAYVA